MNGNISVVYPITGMIWVFGWAMVMLIAWHLTHKRRQRMLEMLHEERMAAMEKGVPLAEFPELETMGGLRGRPSWRRVRLTPQAFLGLGLLCICVGIGVCVALMLSRDPYHQQVWSMGLIGVFFGIGLLLNYAVMRSSKPDDLAPDHRA